MRSSTTNLACSALVKPKRMDEWEIPRCTACGLIHLTNNGGVAMVSGFMALSIAKWSGHVGLKEVGIPCTTTVKMGGQMLSFGERRCSHLSPC